MEDYRWLWAIGAVLGLQLTVMPSTTAHIAVLKQSPWMQTLDAVLSETFLNEAITAQALKISQRHTNTISLNADDLDEPHRLTIETTADFSGQVTIIRLSA
ncbi:MAG: hypothetical protein ACFBSG_10650 [Leptolyngbyaceae cyanobacterium]